MGEVLDRDVGDAEERPGGHAEQQSLGAMQDAAVGGDRQQRGAECEDRALDRDQRRQRGALLLHVGALALAPLSIVQAVLSGGWCSWPFAERFFDFKLGRWQWFGVGGPRRRR